jgi:hypothetical protein
MTNRPIDCSGVTPSYSLIDVLKMRTDGTASPLGAQATAPVLLDGSWWAIHKTEPSRRYRLIQIPAVIERLNELARKLAAMPATVEHTDARAQLLDRAGDA